MAEPPSRAAIRLAAPAKINLYLHVVGRRSDGYHLLDSLVAFAGIGDTLTAQPADGFSLALDGPFAHDVPAGDDNLVLKAARALATAAGARAGARLTLVKRLPAASGIGGGSADAAACLRALVRLWNVDIDDKTLATIALALGADVPVCLKGHASYLGAIGEDLALAPVLPKAWIVLANPRVPLATPDVFRARQGPFSAPARLEHPPADAADLARLLAARRNDLTEAAIGLAPAIGEALEALARCPGALIARMSGSGATCFALFANVESATEAAFALVRAHPKWWVKAGSLESDAGRIPGF